MCINAGNTRGSRNNPIAIRCKRQVQICAAQTESENSSRQPEIFLYGGLYRVSAAVTVNETQNAASRLTTIACSD